MDDTTAGHPVAPPAPAGLAAAPSGLTGWRTRCDLAAIGADGWAWQGANPNGYGA